MERLAYGQNSDNYVAMFAGFVVCGVVAMIPELRAVMAGLGGYFLGYRLMEMAQQHIKSNKTSPQD